MLIILIKFLRKSHLSSLTELVLCTVPTFFVSTSLAKLRFAGCLVILIGLINPISANQNTIVIKRKTAKKKALLDYKFVFMQEQTAFKASPQSQQRNSQINYPRSAKLTGVFANPQKIHQQIIVQKPKPQTTQTQSKAIDIYDDNNWNDYATESSLDTSLGVKAWIIGK